MPFSQATQEEGWSCYWNFPTLGLSTDPVPGLQEGVIGWKVCNHDVFAKEYCQAEEHQLINILLSKCNLVQVLLPRQSLIFRLIIDRYSANFETFQVVQFFVCPHETSDSLPYILYRVHVCIPSHFGDSLPDDSILKIGKS